MAEHPPASGGTERTQTGALAGPQHGLLRRGFVLEFATLGWNVVGIVVLAVAAVGTRSVALAGFGLDSLSRLARAPWWSGSCRAPVRTVSAGPCG